MSQMPEVLHNLHLDHLQFSPVIVIGHVSDNPGVQLVARAFMGLL